MKSLRSSFGLQQRRLSLSKMASASEMPNYVSSQLSLMPNITLALPEEIYRKMKRRRDVKWSEVARRAIVERLERVERPVGFYASTSELRDMIERSGVKLEKISIEEAIRHYRKVRELEWRRISTIPAN